VAHPPDIFTSRGITPPWKKGGEVARRQGFVHYEGAGWRERRAFVAAHEPFYGRAEHPDPDKARELWMRDVVRELGPPRRDARGHLVYPHAWLAYEEGRVPAALARKRGTLSRRTRQAWATWLRKALACDGWLLPRYAVMPDHEEHDFRHAPAAQLRPDLPVVMGAGIERHRHDVDLTRLERRAHETKACDVAPKPGDPGYPHRVAIEHPAGAFLPTGHLHPITGEIVVPFENKNGSYIRHPHWKHAKYIYTPGDTALRLGTSPVALERGWGGPGDLFVFVLEGTLKMCSVVEAGYPAIDAGSVTLWHGSTLAAELGDEGELLVGELHELEAFADRHLHGRPVAVVCDSDWRSNDLVWEQTQKVVGLLQRHGADAVACAPPEGALLGWADPITGKEKRVKVGVDDWLGPEYQGTLLDLVCDVRQGAATLTADDPRLLGGGKRGTYRSRRENAVRVLKAMGEMALPDSDIAPFLKTELAALLVLPSSTVQDAFELAVQRELATRITEARYHWSAAEGRGAMTAPLVRLAPEALPQKSQPTLREWLRQRAA
jgi:hypothetical protein